MTTSATAATQKNTAGYYATWSRDELVRRVADLELALTERQSESSSKGKSKSRFPPAPAAGGTAKKEKAIRPLRVFDASQLPCRKIALRFSYDGKPYSGLAATNSSAPEDGSAYLAGGAIHRGTAVPPVDSQPPSVEAVLWSALVQARLVDEAGGMFKAGWSRCGRTDRGVSAAGQVVALWVRSRRVDERALREREEAIKNGRLKDKETREILASAMSSESASLPLEKSTFAMQARSKPLPERINIEGHETELAYVIMLNRLLPPQIRVQAWSPVRPDFSARFDCRYRHYKYFFNQGVPASLYPVATPSNDFGHIPTSPRLDIGAMQAGAARMLGEHDFRHLCKVDASKQLTHFFRRVDGVSIDRVGSGWPTLRPGQGAETAAPSVSKNGPDDEPLYVLNLRGTAFLYHQVRHMMAVLLLIGAQLEAPSLVDELLNVKDHAVHRDWSSLGKRHVDHPSVSEDSNVPAATVLPNSTATSRDDVTAAMGLALLRHQAALLKTGNEEPAFSDEFDVSELDLPVTSSIGVAAALSPRAQRALDRLAEAYVYTTKPSYEMAGDGPLVLWDCGFRECDIQWRSGGWDGWEVPALDETVEDNVQDLGEQAHSFPLAVLRPAPPAHLTVRGSVAAHAAREADCEVASRTNAGLHASWVGKAIEAEVQRHFVLAAPGPRQGRLAAGRTFEESRWPFFVARDGGFRDDDTSSEDQVKAVDKRPRSYPVGGGQIRPAQSYMPFRQRKRDESAEEKNLRWREGRGKRRADRKGCEAEDLAKGGSVRSRQALQA